MDTAVMLAKTPALREARRRIDLWRTSRAKWGPMPAELWREAALLAQRYGIYRVACSLRLEYYALKRQLEAVRSQPQIEASRQAFVEVSVCQAAALPKCSVEMERPDGAKMRVKVQSREDLIALSESFWGRPR